MRKFIYILLALIMSMSVSACGAQQGSPEEKKPHMEEIIEEITQEEQEATNKEESEEKDYSQYVIAAYQQGVLEKDFDEKIDGKLADVTLVDGQPLFEIVKAVEQYQKLSLVVDWYDEYEGISHRSLLTYHIGKDNWRILSSVVFQSETMSDKIQISDIGLEERAVYLLDPYILPVSWWMGGTEEKLNALSSRNYPYLKNIPIEEYDIVNRFEDIADMKRCTEKIVTKAYAENILYPLVAEDTYKMFENRLCWKRDSATDIGFLKPESAQLISRDGGVAEVLVSFEDGSQSEVELLLEDGVWKLNSTPYTESDAPAEWDGLAEGNIGEEAIEDRLVQLLGDTYTNPTLWWLVGGDQTNQLGGDIDKAIIIEDVPLTIDGIDDMSYYPLNRFNSINDLKKATEQVVTKEYAEKYLYPRGEERHLFLELDGILYGNGYYMVSTGIGGAVDAELIGQKGNSYWLVGEFGALGGETVESIIEMKLEDGIWKLNNTQLDK